MPSNLFVTLPPCLATVTNDTRGSLERTHTLGPSCSLAPRPSRPRHRPSLPVKTPRVAAQNGGFVVLREIGPFQHFVDFFHAIGNGNLMGEVRREHKRLRANACNGVGQGLFVAFAPDKNPVSGEI